MMTRPDQGITGVIFAAVVLAIFLSGCDEAVQDAQLLAARPTTEPTPAAAKETAPSEIIPDTGWIQIKAGLEGRRINIISDEGTLKESVYLARVDPDFFRFEIGYQPDNPPALQSWLDESGASLAINGGFFTEENEATGLVIANGESYGQSYQDFGGMLAINKDGPKLRWLGDESYSPDEELIGAVQSFPMLVLPGDPFAYSNSGDDAARRSVIARDRQGKFILIVAGIGFFTLNELSQFLIDSDLELELALNLDGGASSGMLLSNVDGGIPSFSLLPIVILVYEK